MKRRTNILVCFFISCMFGGVFQTDAQPGRMTFERLKVSEGVCCVFQDSRGFLWFGTTSGLVRYDGYDFVKYRRDPENPKSIANDTVWVVGEDRLGNMWVGTVSGLDRFDRATGVFTHFPHDPKNPKSMSSNGASVIHCDRDGTLWIGSWEGLSKFDPETETFTHFQYDSDNEQTLFGNKVSSIVEAPSRSGDGTFLWIGTNDGRIGKGGLNRFDCATGRVKRYIHIPGDPKSLAENNVGAICLDKSGRLWVGSNVLQLFDPSRGTFVTYPNNDTELWSGLGVYIQGIKQMKQGTLWISTVGSVVWSFEPRTGVFEPYHLGPVQDGKLRTDLLCTVFIDREGTIWSGYFVFGLVFGQDFISRSVGARSPGDIVASPSTAIVDFTKSGERAALDSAVSEKKVIELSHNDDVFSFGFAALSYTNPEQNQFAYKLEGYDREWVYSGNRHSVRYSGVTPGNYVFRVKGSDSDGRWDEEGASIVVVVNPPFWRTTWFLAAFCTAIVGSAAGTTRYVRVKRMKKRIAQLERERELERERIRISQSINEQIGAGLTEIRHLSGTLKSGGESTEEARKHVEQISARAAVVTQNIGDLVWAMNPGNDSVDNLMGRLRRYAVELFKETQIRCVVHFPEVIPASHCSAEQRYDILIATKEALQNVYKHSCANDLILHADFQDSTLHIRIEDNGKGFDVGSQSVSGNGLATMRKRIEDIRGNVKVNSSPGSGTVVDISVHLGPVR